jgi:hypothetical protein
MVSEIQVDDPEIEAELFPDELNSEDSNRMPRKQIIFSSLLFLKLMFSNPSSKTSITWNKSRRCN